MNYMRDKGWMDSFSCLKQLRKVGRTHTQLVLVLEQKGPLLFARCCFPSGRQGGFMKRYKMKAVKNIAAQKVFLRVSSSACQHQHFIRLPRESFAFSLQLVKVGELKGSDKRDITCEGIRGKLGNEIYNETKPIKTSSLWEKEGFGSLSS